MRIHRTLQAFVSALMLASCIGCSVQLYSGEDLPDEEASRVTVRRTSPDIVLESVTIDGKSVPSYATSASLIPGDHFVLIRYRVEVREMCDPRDYSCPATILQGRCEGYISTEMGSRDVIVVDNSSGEMRAAFEPRTVISALTTTDGVPPKDLPCSKPSRYDQLGRAGT
jgi:hypothetical protein